jgi:hypothetical protein
MSFNWWHELETHKDEMIRLIEKFHPAKNVIKVVKEDEPNYIITAKKAEELCESIRQDIQAEYKGHPVIDFLSAFNSRDGETIHSILNQTWFGMPESIQIRYEPGFNTLCDLCSEYEGE